MALNANIAAGRRRDRRISEVAYSSEWCAVVKSFCAFCRRKSDVIPCAQSIGSLLAGRCHIEMSPHEKSARGR